MRNRCGYCGDNIAMPLQRDGDTIYNIGGCGIKNGLLKSSVVSWCGGDTAEIDYGGFNLTGVAEMCMDPSSYLVNIIADDGIVYLEGSLGNGQPKPFTKASVQEWCKSCVTFGSASDHVLAVDGLAQGDVMYLSMSSMGLFDWVALLLVCFVVSTTLTGELKVRINPGPLQQGVQAFFVHAIAVRPYRSSARVFLNRLSRVGYQAMPHGVGKGGRPHL
jgi:hypothetical protein